MQDVQRPQYVQAVSIWSLRRLCPGALALGWLRHLVQAMTRLFMSMSMPQRCMQQQIACLCLAPALLQACQALPYCTTMNCAVTPPRCNICWTNNKDYAPNSNGQVGAVEMPALAACLVTIWA